MLIRLIQSLLTPFSSAVLALALYLIQVFFYKKMLMYQNALATYSYCKLYKKAALQSLALLLIRRILYYTNRLLKFRNSLLLKSQQYRRQKASPLSIQISSFLLCRALIVLRRLYQFYLLVCIVNIRGIQCIGPSPLNLKVNRSKILVERLLLPQVSIQWPSRISISVQRQHSGKESLQAYSQRQMFLNLSSIYPLSNISLSLSANWSFSYCISLHYKIFKYSLILSSYRNW